MEKCPEVSSISQRNMKTCSYSNKQTFKTCTCSFVDSSIRSAMSVRTLKESKQRIRKGLMRNMWTSQPPLHVRLNQGGHQDVKLPDKYYK